MSVYVLLRALHDGAQVRVPAVKKLDAPTGASAAASDGGGTIADNTTYYYKVTALGDNGETVGSNETSATTGVYGGDGSITVSWTNVTGAKSYRVYRGTTAAFTSGVYFADTDGSSFVDTGAAGTAGTVPTSNTASIKDGQKKLTTTTDTLVDVDDVKVRKALNEHRAIGQYVVSGVNNRYRQNATTITALPTNEA